MEQYINSACEQFRKLLTEQLERTERMEKGAVKKDYLRIHFLKVVQIVMVPNHSYHIQ